MPRIAYYGVPSGAWDFVWTPDTDRTCLFAVSRAFSPFGKEVPMKGVKCLESPITAFLVGHGILYGHPIPTGHRIPPERAYLPFLGLFPISARKSPWKGASA